MIIDLNKTVPILVFILCITSYVYNNNCLIVNDFDNKMIADIAGCNELVYLARFTGTLLFIAIALVLLDILIDIVMNVIAFIIGVILVIIAYSILLIMTAFAWIKITIFEH